MKKLVAILPVLLFLSCKKEEIKDPVVQGAPVFTASVQIGGESVTLEAGKDGVYMSTFTEQVNGVERYSGKLGTSDTYVELGVFQGDLDIQDPFSLKNFQGLLTFAAQPTGPLAVLSKNDFPNPTLIDHIIWFKDGVQAGYNQLAIHEPGTYEICAEVHFFDGEVHELCNELVLGYHTNGNCSLNHELTMEGDLQVWLEQSTVQVSSVKWFMDGNMVSTSNALSLNVDDDEHLIEAVITFNNGSVRKKAMLVDGSLSGHLLSDFTHVESGPMNQIRWDYAVVLKIVKDGNQYSSLTANNLDSSVEITDIQYYGLNDQGKKVYKCTGTVSAFVRELVSGEVLPVSINTVFGLEMN